MKLKTFRNLDVDLALRSSFPEIRKIEQLRINGKNII